MRQRTQALRIAKQRCSPVVALLLRVSTLSSAFKPTTIREVCGAAEKGLTTRGDVGAPGVVRTTYVENRKIRVVLLSRVAK
jgi:hypothetical protein